MIIRLKTTLLGFLLALAVAGGCKSDPTAGEPLPPWLLELIAELEGEPPRDPPLWIGRYEYHRRLVYYLPPRGCCDFWSTLYDASGSVLCHPDGGITGMGDGRCVDFLSERRAEKIVWRDSRTPATAQLVPARPNPDVPSCARAGPERSTSLRRG